MIKFLECQGVAMGTGQFGNFIAKGTGRVGDFWCGVWAVKFMELCRYGKYINTT